MSVKETPLAKVKRIHGSKDKLVDAIVAEVAKDSDESEAELKTRLSAVSNLKLLRLHDSLQHIKSQYGSKDKLVAALVAAKGKSKDTDFSDKLQTQSVHRLIDMMSVESRRAKAKAKH